MPPASAPSNQFNKYYFEGTYDNCPTRFKSWQTCLHTKISKHEDAEALRQRVSSSLRAHVAAPMRPSDGL